jgi:O-methyltransferase involved in polyketide biosynthesis
LFPLNTAKRLIKQFILEIRKKIDLHSLTNVPETMLVPLFLKAKETKENGIISDSKSVDILGEIDYDFSKLEKDWVTQISVAIRTYLFDQILITQTAALNQSIVVNLGAGLDTRQERFPNHKWYQLDLPESIAIRKHFFKNDKTKLIAKSILDFSWINEIEERENILFIAEGLFMYFSEIEVKSILGQISRHFKDSFIAFNTLNKYLVKKKHPSIDPNKAPFKWGIRSIEEIEDWELGWKQFQTFYPLDYYKSRWKWIRWTQLIPNFKKGITISLMQTVSLNNGKSREPTN